MSYVSPEEFKQRYFGESKHPSMPTLRRLLDLGKLKGRKLGGLWFVDLIAFEADNNSLVEKVLRDVSRST